MTHKEDKKKSGSSDLPYAMAGFFDLLGFSDRVENINSLTDLENITKAVERVRNRFEYRTEDKWTKEVHQITDKTVLAFSDCIVTSVPLHTQTAAREGLFDFLGSEIEEIALSQVSCILGGGRGDRKPPIGGVAA
jgi:hypothetical protein